MEKTCSKCGGVFPLTVEFWMKRKSSKDGFRADCRICRTAYKKRYRKKNAESIAGYLKSWKKNNPEKVIESQKRQQIKNAKPAKEYRKKTPEEIAEARRIYRKKNTKKLIEFERNRSKKDIEQLTRRYVKRALRASGYTPAQITPELIQQRRNQILCKRLMVPIGTDVAQVTEAAPPAWI